ncbi:integrating conjugative element protein [Pseudomonas chlororaphis]|uniref:integrating conjugative element protein n=1 Tax=Pseudomonas chlororaphis TaxID=587753 RepID=UPI000471C60A|nr:integrating conjugative element protein [Pseudomonas chlororaphis]
MKFNPLFISLGLAVWLSPAAAQLLPPPLIVVDDRGGSSALPYYEALAPQTDALQQQLSAAPPRRYSEVDMLPVHSRLLTPGPVQQRSIQAPGLTPLFLVGDDDRSRAWLQQRLADLRQINAVGLVVNVETVAALQALRALAPGLELVPVAADDLAQRLGLSHYPALLTTSNIEQ